MQETTKEERARAWRNGPRSFLARVIRDADAAEEVLRGLLRACSPPEPYDTFAFWDGLQEMDTPTARSMLKARELLRDPQQPADVTKG